MLLVLRLLYGKRASRQLVALTHWMLCAAQEEVREQVARFLKIHFGWSADEIQHETLHQQGILDHILAKAAAGSDEEGDRVPAAATPDHNAINQRGEQGMLQPDVLVGLC